MRRVEGLRWAQRSTNPWPKTRAGRGTKGLGLRFEKLVAKQFPIGEHNPWFKYEDKTGVHYCSPDVLIPVAVGRYVIVECKLTNWSEAWDQLRYLYMPVLKLALGSYPFPVVVTKHVNKDAKIVTNLRQAIEQMGQMPVLHWIGRGPFPLE